QNKNYNLYLNDALTISKFHSLGEGKIKDAKAGKNHIEDAVKADKENIEIRLVRLIIQENTPKIAGYKENIKEDKEFIIKHFKSRSEEHTSELQSRFDLV